MTTAQHKRDAARAERACGRQRIAGMIHAIVGVGGWDKQKWEMASQSHLPPCLQRFLFDRGKQAGRGHPCTWRCYTRSSLPYANGLRCPVGRAKASPSNGRHIQKEGVGGWDKDLDGQRHAMPLATHVEKILRDRFLGNITFGLKSFIRKERLPQLGHSSTLY